MSDLQLDFDEDVILTSEYVTRHVGDEQVNIKKMVLTNKHIIFVTVKEVGFFHREVETVEKVPLTEIKLINGQACVDQLKAGLFGYQLQIHYINGAVKYSFNSGSKKATGEWKEELSLLLAGSGSYGEDWQEPAKTEPALVSGTANYTQKAGSFCPNCGAQVTPDANYCPECGAPVRGSSSPTSSSRGYADDEISRVRQFCDQLMNLESGRGHTKIRHMFSLSPYPTDMQKLSLIRNFPIPDTLDGIQEFIALAIANIDVNLSRNTLLNRLERLYKIERETKRTIPRTISDAWVTKLQQAYQKALQQYSTEPRFPYIEQLYSDEMAELKIK